MTDVTRKRRRQHQAICYQNGTLDKEKLTVNLKKTQKRSKGGLCSLRRFNGLRNVEEEDRFEMSATIVAIQIIKKNSNMKSITCHKRSPERIKRFSLAFNFFEQVKFKFRRCCFLYPSNSNILFTYDEIYAHIEMSTDKLSNFVTATPM